MQWQPRLFEETIQTYQ